MPSLNPNQFSLPGMEHLSHPLAPYLAKGFYVTHEQRSPIRGFPHTTRTLSLREPESFGAVSHLEWLDEKDPSKASWYRPEDHPRGEIMMVQTQPEYQRQGMARALFETARKMPGVKPRHSADRTVEGEGWARAVGGRVPRNRGGFL